MKKSPYLRHNKEKNLFNSMKYNSKHSLPVDSYIDKLASMSATKLVNKKFNMVKQFACIRYIRKDNRVINSIRKTKNLIKLLEFIGDNITFKISRV